LGKLTWQIIGQYGDKTDFARDRFSCSLFQCSPDEGQFATQQCINADEQDDFDTQNPPDSRAFCLKILDKRLRTLQFTPQN
jgi:hypothetical protein